MIRTSFILTLVLALLLGSLGMPLTLHSCQMAGMDRQVASTCGMCGGDEREHHQDDRVEAPNGCCSVESIVRQLLPTVQSLPPALPAPAAVALYDLLAQLFDRYQVITTVSPALDANSPPSLSERGRTTYLRNSCFLI